MEIKAADVAKLRKMTGAGMMDCKKALVEAEGDYDRAQEIIREKGKLVAAKRADRETSEGAVLARVKGNKAILVSLGCETDFVAGNADFKALANSIADAVIDAFPANIDEVKSLKLANGLTVEAAITEQTGKSGEKHVIAFYDKIEAPYIGSYIHINNKVGAIVGFNKEVPAQLGKEIAMQVTAMSPVSVSKDDCPQTVVDKEMEIYREQLREENKPEAMVEQIAKGKLNKFFKESTLEEQEFIMVAKISVADHIKSIDKDAKVTGFRRYSLTD